MSNPFASIQDNSILKDERYLYPDYIPQILPFREKEISEMVFCLKPSTLGKKPTNIFVTGHPGTGKTVTSKFVLSELEEYSDRAKTVYINCFETSSSHSILAKATNVMGYPVPARGFSVEEIFERFTATIRNKKIIPILVFDEAEQLLKKEDTKKILYDLARLGEQLKLFIGLVFISNDQLFLSLIDDRIRSSLNASTISFEKYTSLELKEILKERAKFAFFPNALDESSIPLCAARASKTGDARIAIDTLLKSARIAERENSKKVLITHVRKAFQQEKPVKPEITKNLTEQEKKILELVKEKELTANQIYSLLKKDFAERTIRKAINDLEQKKLVKIEAERQNKSLIRKISKNN